MGKIYTQLSFQEPTIIHRQMEVCLEFTQLR